MLEVKALAALSDNYIWVIGQAGNDTVAVVDPGEAGPVQHHLAAQGLRVGAFLITHHHADHTGGLDALLAEHDAPVYGPRGEAEHIPRITDGLAGGERFELDFLDTQFAVIDVPGHTLGHIALVTDGVLLAGDTLFRAGCGRVFEGTATQMQQSLAALRDLPAATRVYAGHEYTQKNLAFARQVEPDNTDIQRVSAEVDALRGRDQPSLPGTIEQERRINPFLRWDNERVIQAASRRADRSLDEPADIFATLRAWKNAS